jgi:hypothetical protein
MLLYLDGMLLIYLYNKKAWCLSVFPSCLHLPTNIPMNATLQTCLYRPTLHPCRLNEFNALDVKEPDEIPVEEVWVTMNLRTRISQSGRSSRKGGRIQCQIPQLWRSSTKGGRIQCQIPQSWRSTRQEEFKVESLNCDRAQGRKNSILLFCGTKECHL